MMPLHSRGSVCILCGCGCCTRFCCMGQRINEMTDVAWSDSSSLPVVAKEEAARCSHYAGQNHKDGALGINILQGRWIGKIRDEACCRKLS